MEPIAILVAPQRSGTHLFRSILETDPRLHCLPEVFNDDYGARNEMLPDLPYFFETCVAAAKQDPAAIQPARRRDLTAGYFEKIREMAVTRGQCLVVDVKTTSLHHADGVWRNPVLKPEMIRIFEDRSIPVIHLRRENVVHLAFSSFRARNTGEYVVSTAAEQSRICFGLPINRFIRAVRRLDHSDRLVRSWLPGGEQVIRLTYEDLFVDRPGGDLRAEPFERVAGLLGIEAPRFDLRPRLRKVAAKRIRDEIENYDELADKLAGTPYEAMLEA